MFVFTKSFFMCFFLVFILELFSLSFSVALIFIFIICLSSTHFMHRFCFTHSLTQNTAFLCYVCCCHSSSLRLWLLVALLPLAVAFAIEALAVTKFSVSQSAPFLPHFSHHLAYVVQLHAKDTQKICIMYAQCMQCMCTLYAH